MALSLVKEARDISIADLSKTSPNRRSGKNKYDNGVPQSEDRVCAIQPIYYGDRQGKQKLLQLWEIWVFDEELQEQGNREQNWRGKKTAIQIEASNRRK